MRLKKIGLLMIYLLMLTPLAITAQNRPKLPPGKDPKLILEGGYSSEVRQKSQEELYDDFIYTDKMWTFRWQHFSSIVIFVVVIIVVLMGLILSYKQFDFTNQMILKHHETLATALQQQVEAAKATGKPAKTVKVSDTTVTQTYQATHIEKTEADIMPGNNSLEISKSGIKINSAVIGLIILVVSIVFFFLYLQFVYPIHEINYKK